MAKTNAESMRNVFIWIIVSAAKKSVLDLQNLLPCPIINYPLSLVYCEGSMVKTGKYAFLNRLETAEVKYHRRQFTKEICTCS